MGAGANIGVFDNGISTTEHVAVNPLAAANQFSGDDTSAMIATQAEVTDNSWYADTGAMSHIATEISDLASSSRQFPLALPSLPVNCEIPTGSVVHVILKGIVQKALSETPARQLGKLLDEDPAVVQRRANLAKRLELYRSAQHEAMHFPVKLMGYCFAVTGKVIVIIKKKPPGCFHRNTPPCDRAPWPEIQGSPPCFEAVKTGKY
ncbi:hypothetical protein V6N11_006906 [Hibiscus sabdariffa]|uniref:Dynamin GTPase effector domain-containing protein n=1 Tax=Hibiscus sabdariffa TaxID=183260 RepID=A0ABR2RSF4_9ROSI